jgi:hypothetical protein
MTDQHQFSPPDAEGFQRMKLTSENGKPFEISVTAAEGVIKTESPLAPACASGKWYDVDWPLGDRTWKTVTGIPRITKYRLLQVNGFVYTYELGFDISSSGLGTEFKFQDRQPDTYVCVTDRGGEHLVSYNSGAPAIQRVWVSDD